jgi:triosephosphate isomerase
MKKVAFVLACSSCIGHGRQVYEDSMEAQLSNEEPVSALAEFLLAMNPGAVIAPRARTSVIDMMARRPVVGGNWKCNPTSKNDLDALIENINACDTGGCDVYVCPSPLHVDYCVDKFTNGAMVTPQNCNFKGTGAYTGEMAVDQMKDMGLTNVLIGHSERRGEFGIFPMDTDDTLATKLKYILDQGLSCVYCIGEPLSIREEGIDAVLAEMDKQLSQIYSLLDPAKVVIAYEPVWAIGTGVTASPEQAQETHAGIRKLIAEKASEEVAENIRIQYGGSSNAANAPDLSAQPDIDGFLVGGASLKPEFKDIVAAIAEAKK